MEDSLVSIVTPAYRAASLIGQTISSVLAQSYANWELLIVDDASPDDTKEVVQRWCEADERIKLIEHRSNLGPAMARNTAIAQAAGRWLAFLDSDDLWLPQKLERALEFVKEHDAPLVFTGYRRISPDGGRVGKYVAVPSRLSYRLLLRNTAIATSTVLIDRNKVPDIYMKNVYHEDFALWLDILRRGNIAFGLNEDHMRYRLTERSLSRDKRRSALGVWNIYRNVENISIVPASINFFCYAINSLIKRRSF